MKALLVIMGGFGMLKLRVDCTELFGEGHEGRGEKAGRALEQGVESSCVRAAVGRRGRRRRDSGLRGWLVWVVSVQTVCSFSGG